MNRIGNWIDMNPEKVYPKESLDDDYVNYRKNMIRIQNEAEKLVMLQ